MGDRGSFASSFGHDAYPNHDIRLAMLSINHTETSDIVELNVPRFAAFALIVYTAEGIASQSLSTFSPPSAGDPDGVAKGAAICVGKTLSVLPFKP